MKNIWQQYKLPILLIIGVILLALLLSGGKYAYNIHTTQVEELERDKITLSRKLDSTQQAQQLHETLIPEIRTTQKNYYYEYKQAQQRAINAEQTLKNILYRTYSIAYLDSLAKHIKYRD